MTKITTKKPGQNTVPPQTVVPEPAIVPPRIDPKKLVETSFGRPEAPPTSQPNISQVKVTRTSPVKVKSFSPSPPPPEEVQKKGGAGRILVPLGGIVLIFMSLSRLSVGPVSQSTQFPAADPEARQMLEPDDPARINNATWRNDEPGFLGKFFRKLCLGYAKSEGCRSAPEHPFQAIIDAGGRIENFEDEEDKKVVEQTIEHKSRAFTFGK